MAEEGVLWLNACLTVRAHKANSHAKRGWEAFTTEVIRAVTSRENGRGVVFFAWGASAQKACDNIKIDEVRVNASFFKTGSLPLQRHVVGKASCVEVNPI